MFLDFTLLDLPRTKKTKYQILEPKENILYNKISVISFYNKVQHISFCLYSKHSHSSEANFFTFYVFRTLPKNKSKRKIGLYSISVLGKAFFSESSLATSYCSARQNRQSWRELVPTTPRGRYEMQRYRVGWER